PALRQRASGRARSTGFRRPRRRDRAPLHRGGRAMKFLCVGCDEPMTLAQAPDPPSQGSLSAIFRCARCGQRVALLTNPWETQLVCSLGVAIGGPEPSRKPLALVRAKLAEAR